MLILLLIGGYLYLESDHLHPLFRLLFLAPVLLILIPIGIFVKKILIARLHRPTLRVGPELLAATLMFVFITLFFTVDRFQLILMALVFCWMLLQLFRKKIGAFYTALTGLIIFATIAFSFRLLHLEETLYLTWRQLALLSEQKREGLRWSVKSGENKFLIWRAGDSRLELEYPPGFFFHPPDRFTDIDLPRPGRVIASFSRQADRPLAPPHLVLYAVDSDLPQTPGDFRSEWELVLGHRRNEGRIEDVRFQGLLERAPPVSKLSLRGLSFGYRDGRSGRRMQDGFFLLRSYRGRQFILAFCAPEVKEMPHHPDILFVLRRLTWRAPAGSSNGSGQAPGARITGVRRGR